MCFLLSKYLTIERREIVRKERDREIAGNKEGQGNR
jgi:hypothetical protein